MIISVEDIHPNRLRHIIRRLFVKKNHTTTSYDFLIKLILVGDSAVGKTSLLLRFTENQVCNDHIATIGNPT